MRRIVTALLVSVLSIGGLGAATQAPAGAATCSTAPTGGLVTRNYAGRQYLIQVPPNLSGPAPLVLSLHGFWAGAQLHATDSQWAPFAAANGFIVAYPNGSSAPPMWQFGRNSIDVAYLRGLVAEISSIWCVEPRRVHATGHSNGALMAMRLACDAADLFASVAEYAGGPATATGSPCLPSRPIAVGIFSSLFDFLSLYPFGWVTRDHWLSLNRCPTTPQREAGVLLEAARYGPCAAGVEVIWRGYLLQSHNWPLGADGNDIRQRMWNLFRNNPLPA